MNTSPWQKVNSSLDFELSLTKRILTHKLSACSVNLIVSSSLVSSPVSGQTHCQKIVPPFPLNELWEILNSLNGKNNQNIQESKNICVDTISGACAITEAPLGIEEEEEKNYLMLGSPRRSSWVTAFRPYVKNPQCCDKSQTMVPNKVTDKKLQKYEKKNIYYKAVFRDVRRYFIEKLKKFSSSRLLRDNITELILLEFPQVNETEVGEMVSILAPFLNYNKYMIEFENKRVEDAKSILDCLQNFTLTKMRIVLQYSAIKKLVNYYFAHTVTNGVSDRLNSHKTMKKNSHKYLEVLHKIVDISNKA